MRVIKFLFIPAFLALSVSACYYDNEQALYPGVKCDTSNVTFSGSVAPVFNAYCISCHNNVSPSNNIDLSSYPGAVAAYNTGRLVGSITWQSGYFQMPKGGSQLSSCDISKIEVWIRAGLPNN
jgi:hypothetical protein